MPNISFNIEGIYNGLHINKSPGPDEIPSRILKYCATEISPVLQIIFTQFMLSGVLPNDWLSANITPVFNKRDKGNPSNYRPISLTAICCKIMEHLFITPLWNTLRIIIFYVTINMDSDRAVLQKHNYSQL